LTLVFRDVKGTPLTHTEVDGNFRHLTASHEVSGSVTATAFIGDGSQLTNVNLSGVSDVSASGNITGSNLLIVGNGNFGGSVTASNLLLTDTESKLTVSEITASNLRLTGDADIVGNITLGGNLVGGDASTDSVTFNADITSQLRPNTDDTYDLGTEALRWQDIHGTAINAEVLALNQITASGTSTLSAGQYGIWIGPFSISGTVDIGLGSNFVLTSFNRMNEIDLINVSDY
tara:strand:+ start:208 stop:903 length:696 start_codon:yes stop_codon:yes gene_type:complete